MTQPRQPRYLRLRTVLDFVPVSRATLFRWERAGLFPRRKKLGPGAVGWVEAEVLAWMAAREAGSTTPAESPRQ